MLTKPTETTAGEMLNLADVRGNILYTRNRTLFAFLSVSPISTALMTEQEKKLLTDKMTKELSPLQSPFRILFLSRPTDVRQIIAFYERIKDATVDTKKRENLTRMMKFFSGLANSGSVLERKTYLAVWKSESEHAADELLAKAQDFRTALLSSGVRAELCPEREIITMLSLFYHPASPPAFCDTTPNLTLLED